MIENLVKFLNEHSDLAIFIYSTLLFVAGWIVRGIFAKDELVAAFKEAEALREVIYKERTQASATVSYRVNPTSSKYQAGNRA